MNKVILIAGPTASGKSSAAIFIAKKLNGEIINADSMQVYKEIKILSARPKNYSGIKHHLYGFLSVKKKFSSGQWLKLATKKIKQIISKNKIPIIVGGTGLYFKLLLEGVSKIPKISSIKRNKVLKLYEKIGPDLFYNKLLKLDPKVFNYVNLNDKQRMIRSYEIKYYTKKSILDWHKETTNALGNFNFVKIFLNLEKTKLHLRIEKRFKSMIKNGAINEVKKFLKLKVKSDLSANHILGLKEIVRYLNKEISLKEAILLSNIRTRQYVKRQMTWQRGQMKNWLSFEQNQASNWKKNLLNQISKS